MSVRCWVAYVALMGVWAVCFVACIITGASLLGWVAAAASVAATCVAVPTLVKWLRS